MSNIHALEPQAYGLIKIETTFGDLDVELFTKQCPKICKNFVKFCLDKFYDKARIHKLEKDFIAIVSQFRGNPNEYDRLPDEHHSRLRFTRRGLIATANTKKNANGPEFFFTLGPTQELQGKHTIFGRVKGDSLYNLVDLNDCPVDEELKPRGDKVINLVTVIENPFPDLEGAGREATKEEEEEEESEESSSDDDERNKLAIDRNKKLSFFPDEDEDEDAEEEELEHEGLQLKPGFRDPIKTPVATQEPPADVKLPDSTDDSHQDINKNTSKEERMREIRAQIQSIKSQLEKDTKTKSLEQRRLDAGLLEKDELSKSNKESSKLSTKNKRLREQETIELLKTFKKKLKQMQADQATNLIPAKNCDNVKEEATEVPNDELAALDQVDGDDWLFHKFDPDERPAKNNSNSKRDSLQDNSYSERGHREYRKRDE